MLCACTNANPAALCAVMDCGRHPDLNKPLRCINNQELTPLSICALAGSWDCCALLLQRGADIATVDCLGMYDVCMVCVCVYGVCVWCVYGVCVYGVCVCVYSVYVWCVYVWCVYVW